MLWFDNLQCLNKPSTAELGLESCYLATNWAWFNYDGQAYDTSAASQAAVHAFFTWFLANRPQPDLLVADIEVWPFDTPAHIADSIEKLKTAFGYVRTRSPGCRLGLYSFMPLRNFHDPVNWRQVQNNPSDGNYAAYLTAYKNWLRRNRLLRTLGLHHHVDFVCPSLYEFYDAPEFDGHPIWDTTLRWTRYAEENIAQARRFGKQVYAYINPQYQPGGTYNDFRFLQAPKWRNILATVSRLCDGAIIYNDLLSPNLVWDPDWEWWQVTQEFIH